MLSDSDEERELSAAHNQALFRAVNEKIREVNDGFEELTGTFVVACECADASCVEMIELPRAGYEDVRRGPHTFVVLAGHVDPEVEQVVGAHDGYVVVEMTGANARAILEDTAPGRSRREES